MNVLRGLYRPSLALLTDLYQLTMAYGFWKSGMADRQAVFHLVFRQNPFRGGFTIASGLRSVIEYLEGFHFDPQDLDYLAGLRGNDGQALFSPDFLDALATVQLTCDVHGLPEGTVVFPQEPLFRVCGPLMQCQLLETPLLNLVNFPTLVATKAARVCLAAGGDDVLEFGLRRAQGIDGGLTASRAAYLGGCAATSNLLAGSLFGIPVRGTHAHSWVMTFETELEAFEAYARALPNNCIFLVDTYETLEGVRNAAKVGRWLRSQGHSMVGIRLDSGDLGRLSLEARRILDEAGLPDALIVASNNLDEYGIAELKKRGSSIAIWGVGTRLATAYEQPALNGVYKLSALRDSNGEWSYRIKLSEQNTKINDPGILQVRRYVTEHHMTGDLIYDENLGLPDEAHLPGDSHQDLLAPIFDSGRRIYDLPSLDDSRDFVRRQLQQLDPGVKLLQSPTPYPVVLEKSLAVMKRRLTEQLRVTSPAQER